MSRIKVIFAVLVLAAIVGVVPQAQAAPNVVVALSGSSALWQTMALGAYNDGTAIAPDVATNKTCHYTSSANFLLTDTRPAVLNGSAPVVDNGATWIVWSVTPPNTCSSGVGGVSGPAVDVWVFTKVDSVVGNRCYFADPKCEISANGAFPPFNNTITVWPDASADSTPGPDITALFAGGGFVSVTGAATDIRPEDAAWAECRVNSPVGKSVAAGALGDGLDGLGYESAGATQGSGACPAFIAGAANFPQDITNGVGTPIVSGYPGHAATDVANVAAFNLNAAGAKDPITGIALPAAYVTYPVGVSPIVFVFERDGTQLAGLTNATDAQLQAAFSGANCDASAFGLGANAISINLREPLSGTYNTTEATVMRRPTIYPTAPGVLGVSMETNVGAFNPLQGQGAACLGGLGARYRAIGTGEEVKSVQKSVANYGHDGIGFTFFSYGNVSSIANNKNYGYITLNGIDPIFQSYGPPSQGPVDPGQPNVAGFPGVLPAEANLPATCQGGPSTWPCSENLIWNNGYSFPNVRNGTYRAWSLLRLVSVAGANGTDIDDLLKASNKYVVSTTPDYIPYANIAAQGPIPADLGAKLLRSHYQQVDGAGHALGLAPVNSPEAGGDMGGFIIPNTIGTSTYKQNCLVQNTAADGSMGPIFRPDTINAAKCVN